MSQRQSDLFGWGKSILSIQYHAVTDIQHQHRGALALMLGFDDFQILTFEINGKTDSPADEGILEGPADIQVQMITKCPRTGFIIEYITHSLVHGFMDVE